MGLQKTGSKVHVKGKTAIGGTITVPNFAEPGSAPDRDGRISASERRQLIATAAYLRAERRGFTAGGELRDWLEAEAEIDQRLNR